MTLRRTGADSLRWAAEGTALVARAVNSLTDVDFDGPSVLAGWQRRHLVAHLSANAEALCNLVHWATTGEPTPMYSSTTQRADDIETGSHRSVAELRAWVVASAATLAERMAAVPAERWSAEVVTAQGRTVPATEIPWLRTREVFIHATDLDAGVTFADLPADFLLALIDDIVTKRSNTKDGAALAVAVAGISDTWTIPGLGEEVAVSGSLSDVAAYLAGRPHGPVLTAAGEPAPALPAWL